MRQTESIQSHNLWHGVSHLQALVCLNPTVRFVCRGQNPGSPPRTLSHPPGERTGHSEDHREDNDASWHPQQHLSTLKGWFPNRCITHEVFCQEKGERQTNYVRWRQTERSHLGNKQEFMHGVGEEFRWRPSRSWVQQTKAVMGNTGSKTTRRAVW